MIFFTVGDYQNLETEYHLTWQVCIILLLLKNDFAYWKWELVSSYSKCLLFNIILQEGWTPWEMLLWPVGWFTALTPITPGQQPSTMHTTPRLDVHGTPTFSSPISSATIPWWPTTPEKKCCTPGTTGVWSLIPSHLRKIRLITGSADDGFENNLIF